MSELSEKENGVSEVDGNNRSANATATDQPDISRELCTGCRQKMPVATMSVDDDDPFYKMNHRKRGICLIINNEKFFVPDLKDRGGTQADRDKLEKTFKDLGFEVIVRNNLTRSATIKKVKEVAEKDHSDSDCFVMCVLSHGKEGVIYATDDCYGYDQIFIPFTADNCPSLAGKPKLYFVQACQGKRVDAGFPISSQKEYSSPNHKIPVHADFMVACATIPGFYSFRNGATGSWFIQTLVTELQKYAMKYDILTILTFVNRRVAIEFKSYCPEEIEIHDKKQVPSITFMLTKLVKFSSEEPS